MELLKLKQLLGVSEEDTSRDVILQFLLEGVQETVLNYCNLEEMPEGLTSTAYRMAVDLYRYDCPGDSAPATVTSITEGDTSTSFADASLAIAGGILKNYRIQLNRYRRPGRPA